MKPDLTRCAGRYPADAGALLSRNYRRPVHPESMLSDLHASHNRNDNVLERSFIS
ncbi:hypothetical protein SAMN04488038_11759 [Solimonas aquatica]|uniref:Uncharacterized protein n=1 Tax=Solimonas aquatica TaxID=489703 RepID=A0A1H9LU74_9GAMM|nr:hypothetical protein SAMN04488038_11759 [Solimonas aquatica]